VPLLELSVLRIPGVSHNLEKMIEAWQPTDVLRRATSGARDESWIDGCRIGVPRRLEV
jgi:hypothetical protein